MRKHLIVGFIALGLVYSCATNPVTGKILTLFLIQLYFQLLSTIWYFLKENKVITEPLMPEEVEAVGMRIKAAAENI
jgi:hypothetical protein